MLRLVKAWAGAHGLNDAAEGTFNSFALGLMVISLAQMYPDGRPDSPSAACHKATFLTYMQPGNRPASAPAPFAHIFLMMRGCSHKYCLTELRHDVIKESL
jgi:DNA polymerase sigma